MEPEAPPMSARTSPARSSPQPNPGGAPAVEERKEAESVINLKRKVEGRLGRN